MCESQSYHQTRESLLDDSLPDYVQRQLFPFFLHKIPTFLKFSLSLRYLHVAALEWKDYSYGEKRNNG